MAKKRKEHKPFRHTRVPAPPAHSKSPGAPEFSAGQEMAMRNANAPQMGAAAQESEPAMAPTDGAE